MNILLVSYGDLRFDGRLRSLISVFSEIGNVFSITRGDIPLNDQSIVCNKAYYQFILQSMKFAKRIDRIDWLVLDNRKATIPGFLIKKRYSPSVTIQDCRELYLIKDVKHLSGKIGCVFERMMVKKADIVICANQERATLMKQEYQLMKTPLTYENWRQLKYSSDEGFHNAEEKYKHFNIKDEIRIISTSGCSIERTNDILVQALSKVKAKCRLFLVGDHTQEEETSIRELMKKYDINNVEILGRINQDELKYLISICHIGVVNYGQYDTNNKFCASGKLYEFLFENKPVVCTTNPPLKRLCDEERIGVADDTYYEGINTIINNYEQYKKHINDYLAMHTIKGNDSQLISQINSEIVK